MRDRFVKTLIEIAVEDKNVYLITGDLGYGVLKPFWELLPQQFINAGIAEQNMISAAAGMAREGKTVFVYSIGNFPTMRCLEQIRNDCAYHDADVKIVCVGGGFSYGSLGMSHHATEDLAIMRALPNLTVTAPADLIEAEEITKAIYKQKGTCYLRLGRGGEEQIHEGLPFFRLGKAIKVKEGERIAIFSTGSIFEEVIAADRLLRSEKTNVALYTFPTVKPIDAETIKKCAQKYDLLVTVEEHNVIGGFGSAVAEVLSETVNKAKLIKIGVADVYSDIAGSQAYLRDFHGLSAAKIAERIRAEINKIE